MFSTAPISHSRIRYPSSSDFSPMMRPAPPTWRKLAGETAVPAWHCGTAGEPFHFENRPGVLRCRKCRQNTGLTVGTVMERSHTPLNVWFWAAYLVASQTPRHVRRAVSAATWSFALRDGLSNSPQASARAWCGPTKTGSVDSPRTMLRWTKPGLAGERVGKAVVFTTRFPSPVPSRCVIESRAPSSTTGKTDAMPDAFGSAVVLDRSAESLCGFVESTVAPGSLIVTDDWSGYAGLGKRGYEHFAVAECGDPECCRAIPADSSIWFSPT